ncbi:MAG: diacylglycerol kinase family lipid kinase [Phycisphaerales bacterium]|nr:diacylglycerol kinase family lipid kinase [Phycisphaerales bacterium]
MNGSTRDILIIANPVSGRGRRRRGHPAETATRALREAARQVELRYTQAGGDAEAFTRSAIVESPGRFGCVAACGGDGTVQQVAHVLADLRAELGDETPALGLIPAGRCNDLASALGLRLGPAEAARVIAEGRAMALDLGRVNGRHYCTVATMGFDAAVSRFVDGMKMPLTGTPAYLYGALRVLMRYASPQVSMEGDFGSRSGRLFMVSTANTATYGGAIPVAPRASPTDGLLDVCILDDAPKLRLVRTLLKVIAGKHEERKGVHLLRTRSLHITADRPLELWADGERVAETPAKLEAAASAIRIFVPG